MDCGKVIADSRDRPVVSDNQAAFDLVRLEQQARAMALVFGIDPDRPYPDAIRLELQKSNAFRPETWELPLDAPAWRVWRASSF